MIRGHPNCTGLPDIYLRNYTFQEGVQYLCFLFLFIFQLNFRTQSRQKSLLTSSKLKFIHTLEPSINANMFTYYVYKFLRSICLQESSKAPTRNQLNTKTAICSLHSTNLHTYHATSYVETISANTSEKIQTIATNYTQELLIADLDPATAKTAIAITGPFLSAMGFLFIIRIVMSWYPKLPVGKFPYVVAYAPTEPILKVTRKVIPPLGGVDVTPVVWFALVSFLNEILVGPQGLLVLLSQQIQS